MYITMYSKRFHPNLHSESIIRMETYSTYFIDGIYLFIFAYICKATQLKQFDSGQLTTKVRITKKYNKKENSVYKL